MAPKENTRRGEVTRETKETRVVVRFDIDDASMKSISTGIGFFDHMLDALATHGRFGLDIRGEGDLHVDQHHLVEDVGIALGTALRRALGEDLRIQRFASAYAPLDDALARAVVDVSGRAFIHFGVEISRPWVGTFDTDLVEEFFRSFVAHAGMNLHLDLLRGQNAHHQLEAVFKATALALRDALRREIKADGVPSTKGTLSEDQARKDA